MTDHNWIASNSYVSINHSLISDIVPAKFYIGAVTATTTQITEAEDDNFNVWQTENLQHSTQHIRESRSHTPDVVNVCYDTRQ
jgi:hypothetical protein